MSEKKFKKNKAKDIAFIALFSVLIAVCSWISVPYVIPFTMQTFAVFLAFFCLGGKRGTVSVCVYLLLGLIGVPVYANFTSGVGVLFGLHGGYMMGWIIAGLLFWIIEITVESNLVSVIVSSIIGLLICYAAGTAWFVVVYADQSSVIGFWSALLICVVPYVLPDVIKITFALFLSERLKKRYQL